MKVTLDSIFGILLEEYPETERVLIKYLGQAYCLTCPGKMYDTIGNGAMLHGLSDDEAMNMVSDLQEVVDSYEMDESKKEEAEQIRAERKESQDAYIDSEAANVGADIWEKAGMGHSSPYQDDEEEPEMGGSPLW